MNFLTLKSNFLHIKKNELNSKMVRPFFVKMKAHTYSKKS